MLEDGVAFFDMQDIDSGTMRYFIENYNGDEFEISKRLWDALVDADGTHPLNLPDKGKKVLPRLKQLGIVRTSRFAHCRGSRFNRITLIAVGSKRQGGNEFYKMFNRILPYMAALFLWVGAYLKITGRVFIGDEVGGWLYGWIYIIMLVVSLAFHEAAHLIAGFAYGYDIKEVGILLRGIIPVGAFVARHKIERGTRSKEVQFALAGVETNFLIAGICYILSAFSGTLSETLISVADMNIVFAVTNLIPCDGLDGEMAFNAIFDVDDFGALTKKWFSDKIYRKRLYARGFYGYVCSAILVFPIIVKIMIGGYIVFSIWSFAKSIFC